MCKVHNHDIHQIGKTHKKHSLKKKEIHIKINKRNVYKSIVRNFITYTKLNLNEITRLLLDQGHSNDEIHATLDSINDYKDVENPKQGKKRFKKLIEEVILENFLLTHVLKESLGDMINDFNLGKYGKISSRNLEGYKEIYNDYYEKAKRILANDGKKKREI